MEVTGVENKRSTPQSRKRKWNRANAIGDLQNFLSQQPFLIMGLVIAVLVAAWLEKVL